MPHQNQKKKKHLNPKLIVKPVTSDGTSRDRVENRSKVCELIECERHMMKEKHLQCFNIELAISYINSRRCSLQSDNGTRRHPGQASSGPAG